MLFYAMFWTRIQMPDANLQITDHLNRLFTNGEIWAHIENIQLQEKYRYNHPGEPCDQADSRNNAHLGLNLPSIC